MNSPQTPINKQSILLAIWFASLVLSIVLYGGKVASLVGGVNVCTYVTMGRMLVALLQPENWLGIFTTALTIFGLIGIAKKAISRWPLLDQYKWVALIALIFVVSIAFSFGCK